MCRLLTALPVRLLIVLALTAIPFWQTTQLVSAQEPTLPCQVSIRGRLIYVFDGTLSMCVKTIQAESYMPGFRYGMWGKVYLAVNHEGQIYFFDPAVGWTFFTTLTNEDNSTGNLADRCRAGDLDACSVLSKNLDRAIDSYDRLYPKGWFR
jgi:hypothetical protein